MGVSWITELQCQNHNGSGQIEIVSHLVKLLFESGTFTGVHIPVAKKGHMKEKLKITNGCIEGYYDGEVHHQHCHDCHHCLYYFNILIPIENVI